MSDQIDEAVDRAVKKFFYLVGVDVDDPQQVEEFRQNLRFGASMRRAADKGLFTVIGVVAATVMSLIIAGIAKLLDK